MRRKILHSILMFLLVAIILFFTSCGNVKNNNDSNESTTTTNSLENPSTSNNVNTYYTITFKNDDGTVLQESNVKMGDLPLYKGETPKKESTSEFDFTFDDWNKKIINATEDTEYIAKYTSTKRKYKITFVDEENNILMDTIEYEYGTKVADIAKPWDPKKDVDDTYRYEFIGWNPKLEDVTCDVTYKPSYSDIYIDYNVKLSINNEKAGTVSGNGSYHYDDSVTINAITNPGYTFDGWYSNEEKVYDKETYTFNLKSNLSYEAKWIQNPNTAYKVEHYLQNIDNDNYSITPYETDNLTGTTDTLTNASVKTYEGFTSPSVTQENINGDGSTVVKLYYTRNSYTVNLSQDNKKAGTITGSGTYKYGKEITIIAETNPGYTFDGWYIGEQMVYDKEAYTFIVKSNVSYEAKWHANDKTAYKVEHYLQNIYDNEYPEEPASIDKLYGVTDTLTEAEVKTYKGFTSPSVTQENINGDGSTVVKLYYTRNTYIVSLDKNIAEAGNISSINDFGYIVENDINNPWIVDGNKITSTNKNHNSSSSYIFKFSGDGILYFDEIASSELQDKLRIYKNGNELKEFTISEKGSKLGQLINVNAGDIIAFNYSKDNSGSRYDDTVYIRNIRFECNNFRYGTELKIEVKPNDGYTFDGWFNGDNQISELEAFDYTVLASDVSFEARFTPTKNTFTIDNQTNLDVYCSVDGDEYDTGTKITISVNNTTSKYLVWYFNDEFEYFGNSYTFNMPEYSIVIKLILSDKLENMVYTRNDNKIYFGTYPQTKVDASEENGLSLIEFDQTKWTSYRYYVNSGQSDYMYYLDVDTNKDGILDYRGVYFTNYRPTEYYGGHYDDSYQEENGYKKKEVYWFSYDPIEWNILAEKDGKALINANLLLDSQEFYPNNSTDSYEHNNGVGYGNNYELSAIRKWLNDTFYNTAFNELEKRLIEETLVDNSSSTTYKNVSSKYICNNTNDNIFLLSYQEASSYYPTDSDRIASGTDYALAQGLLDAKSNPGHSYWLLRSPYNYDICVYRVNAKGVFEGAQYVYQNMLGIRPACWIEL